MNPPAELISWVQLIFNASAVLLGGIVFKQYIQNLKSIAESKQADADLQSERADFWHAKVGELEKQAPAMVEKVLTERIEIREAEINRLNEDRESNSQDHARLRGEIALLKRSQEQTRGFREVLALETPQPDDDGYEEYLEALREYPPPSNIDVEIVHMGSVGVDSGQLMITDPCYIDSEWELEEYEIDRCYKDSDTAEIFRLGADFERYDRPLESYGLSPRELIASGRWLRVPPKPLPATFKYSYRGACQATTDSGHGELVYRKGHPGAAVVFQTGWGDGIYEIFGEKHDGRIVRAYLNMGADPIMPDDEA